MIFKILGIIVLIIIALFVLALVVVSIIHFIMTLSREDEMYDGYDDFYD